MLKVVFIQQQHTPNENVSHWVEPQERIKLQNKQSASKLEI